MATISVDGDPRRLGTMRGCLPSRKTIATEEDEAPADGAVWLIEPRSFGQPRPQPAIRRAEVLWLSLILIASGGLSAIPARSLSARPSRQYVRGSTIGPARRRAITSVTQHQEGDVVLFASTSSRLAHQLSTSPSLASSSCPPSARAACSVNRRTPSSRGSPRSIGPSVQATTSLPAQLHDHAPPRTPLA